MSHPGFRSRSTTTTHLEKLVGAHGGGSHDTQVQELKNIAWYLGIRCDAANIRRIADQLFGGTPTFRRGIIGSWHNHFLIKYKRAFKKIAGQPYSSTSAMNRIPIGRVKIFSTTEPQ